MVGTGYVGIGVGLISDGQQTRAVCQAFAVAAVDLFSYSVEFHAAEYSSTRSGIFPSSPRAVKSEHCAIEAIDGYFSHHRRNHLDVYVDI